MMAAEMVSSTTEKPVYVVGLDLGQTQELSAIAVLERLWRRDDTANRLVSHYAVGHLHRWPLGTPYPAIMADVVALVATPTLGHPYLAVDQSGVGSAGRQDVGIGRRSSTDQDRGSGHLP